MQMLELPKATHPFFIGAQFHPELTSRPLSPNPMFMGLVAAGIQMSDPGASLKDIPERWCRTASGDSTSSGKPLAGTA